MKIRIAKQFTFDAAHRLSFLPPDHKCHRMHGHTYRVELVLEGECDDNGMLIDYAEIAQAWQPLHDLLDHRILNEVAGLERPTTESLAWWIWRKMRTGATAVGNALCAVRVHESSTTYAEVSL